VRDRVRFVLVTLALLGSTGCLIWPFPTGTILAGRGRIRSEDQAAFAVGKTTREEVLLQLGTPAAHFEGERILTYAYVKGSGDAWVRVGRYWNREKQAFEYLGRSGNCNLVLVFGADGRLVRHSLVVSQ
jgi:hypothetical protein